MYSHEKNEIEIVNFIKNHPVCNLNQIVRGTNLDENAVTMYIDKLEKLNRVVKVSATYTSNPCKENDN